MSLSPQNIGIRSSSIWTTKSISRRRLPILTLFAWAIAGLAASYMFWVGYRADDGFARITVILYGASISAIVVWLIQQFRRTNNLAILFVFAGQLYWFVWPGVLVAITRERWFTESVNYILRPEDVILACILLTVFAVGFFISYHLMMHYQPKSKSSPDTDRAFETEKNVIRPPWMLIAVLLLLGVLPYLLSGEGVTGIVTGVLGSRSDVKGWGQVAFQSNPIYVIGRACLVLTGSMALTFALKPISNLQRLFLALLFAGSFSITFFDSGTRTWTGMIILPSLLIILGERRIRGSYLAIMAVIAAAILLTLTRYQLAFRDIGVPNLGGLTAPSTKDVISVPGDSDFLSETAVAASLVPGQFPYVRESVVVLFLSNPIPRSWWPTKPYPRSIQIYGIGRTGRDEYLTLGVSRMPSIVGQYYMNWGWAGVVFIGLVYGIATAALDRRWEEGPKSLEQLFLVTTMAWLFFSYRGMYPGFHYPALILGVLLATRGPLAGLANANSSLSTR